MAKTVKVAINLIVKASCRHGRSHNNAAGCCVLQEEDDGDDDDEGLDSSSARSWNGESDDRREAGLSVVAVGEVAVGGLGVLAVAVVGVEKSVLSKKDDRSLCRGCKDGGGEAGEDDMGWPSLGRNRDRRSSSSRVRASNIWFWALSMSRSSSIFSSCCFLTSRDFWAAARFLNTRSTRRCSFSSAVFARFLFSGCQSGQRMGV